MAYCLPTSLRVAYSLRDTNWVSDSKGFQKFRLLPPLTFVIAVPLKNCPILASLSDSTLQLSFNEMHIQNSAARVLHWAPKFCLLLSLEQSDFIVFKIITATFIVIHAMVVKYLFKTMPKLGDRAFMAVALKLLNILVHNIRNTTDFTLFKQVCTF